MSTDIIRFDSSGGGDPQRTFSIGALRLYLALTVILTFITVTIASLYYRWEKKKAGPRWNALDPENGL